MLDDVFRSLLLEDVPLPKHVLANFACGNLNLLRLGAALCAISEVIVWIMFFSARATSNILLCSSGLLAGKAVLLSGPKEA